ncbi:MAG: NAC family transcription factor [Methanoregula sp.]|nr:NAC family transcription factor [Methanoregula sp.]
MPGDDKDGYYCSICGGIPPDKIKTKRILIDGKETGIDHLEFIFNEVKKLKLIDNTEISHELLKSVKVFNYVPTKKTAEYAAALLGEYRKFVDEQ